MVRGKSKKAGDCMTFKAASDSQSYLSRTGSYAERLVGASGDFSEGQPLVRLDDSWDVERLEEEDSKLLVRLAEIDDKILSVKEQIEIAKTKRWTDKTWSDPDWFRRVNSKLRFLGRDRQSIQNLKSEINRRIKNTRQKMDDWDDGRMFINAAKDILPRNTILEIWAEVRRRRVL